MAATETGFIWYELMTDDLDQAIEFYSKVVGWEVRDSGMPGMRYLLFGKDGKDVGGMMSSLAMSGSKPTKWLGHIATSYMSTPKPRLSRPTAAKPSARRKTSRVWAVFPS